MTKNDKNMLISWFLVILGSISLVLYLDSIFRYINFPSYLDHAEPNVVFRSWRLLNGEMIYNPIDSEFFLIVAYGPVLFLINAFYFKLLGSTILVSKLSPIIASLLSVMVFVYYAWREFGFRLLGIGIFIFVCFLLFGTPYTIWTRPEPHIIFFVTLSLVAGSQGLRAENIWLGPILVAILIGLSVNVKVHSFIYFIPVVILYCSDHYLKVWPIMAVISILVFLSPFALPQISMEHYIEGVKSVVSVRSIILDSLYVSIRYATSFIIPGILALTLVIFFARNNLNKRNIFAFGLFVVCVIVGLYPSSLPGTAWNQLIPFIPVSVALFLHLVNSLSHHLKSQYVIFTSLILIFAVLSVTPQKRFRKNIEGMQQKTTEAVLNVKEILEKFPDKTIEMGYGSDVAETYKLTFVKPILAFAGNPVTVDGWSDMESYEYGSKLQASKLKRFKHCKTNLWLIPRAELPFTMDNYSPGKKAFWPEYVTAFMHAHEKIDTSTHFDIWRCRSRN